MAENVHMGKPKWATQNTNTNANTAKQQSHKRLNASQSGLSWYLKPPTTQHFTHLITLGPNTPYLSIGAKSKFNLRTDEPAHLGAVMASIYIYTYIPISLSQVLSLRFLIKN